MRVLVVTNMYPTSARPAFGTFVKEQVDSLINAGVDVDVFAFEGTEGLKSYLRAARSLGQILHRNSYDLLHAHYGLSGAVARMQMGYPVVITFHGSDLMTGINPQQKTSLIDRLATIISNVAAFGASQRIIVADILKAKLWRKSAVTIPMGVDMSLFKPIPADQAREQLGLSHDKQRVIFVAHPQNPVKRFDLAQAAVQLVQQARPNVELLPVYNVPHHQVPIYMNAGDALVLTSYREASPCIIKEAMACNLPIVTVPVGDVVERLKGVEGCYICDQTPEDIAAKLCKVLDDDRRTNSREKIQSLSLPSVAQQVIEVYKKTLAA